LDGSTATTYPAERAATGNDGYYVAAGIELWPSEVNTSKVAYDVPNR
jgi:hypothetical protein